MFNRYLETTNKGKVHHLVYLKDCVYLAPTVQSYVMSTWNIVNEHKALQRNVNQVGKKTQEIPMQSRNWTFTTTPPQNYNRNSNKSQNEVFLKFLLQSAFMWQQNYVSKATVHWSINTPSWETSVFHNIKEEEHCGCSPILLLLLTHVAMTDMRHFCDNTRIQILKIWCWLIKELLARSVNTHTGTNCLALLLIAGKKTL